MLSLLDVVLEPAEKGAKDIASTATSAPWMAAYIVIGVLICIAVFLIIRRILKVK